MRRIVGVFIASILVFAGLAGPAEADPGSPGLSRATDAVYPDSEVFSGGGEGSLSGGDPFDPSTTGGSGSLPFTGFFAPVLLIVAAALLAMGMATRHLPPLRH